MRKTVSCKIIKSTSLKDSNLFKLSSEVFCPGDVRLRSNKTFTGQYIYSKQLRIIKIYDNNTFMARILDLYI
jgi:hypothetical protein